MHSSSSSHHHHLVAISTLLLVLLSLVGISFVSGVELSESSPSSTFSVSQSDSPLSSTVTQYLMAPIVDDSHSDAIDADPFAVGITRMNALKELYQLNVLVSTEEGSSDSWWVDALESKKRSVQVAFAPLFVKPSIYYKLIELVNETISKSKLVLPGIPFVVDSMSEEYSSNSDSIEYSSQQSGGSKRCLKHQQRMTFSPREKKRLLASPLAPRIKFISTTTACVSKSDVRRVRILLGKGKSNVGFDIDQTVQTATTPTTSSTVHSAPE